MVSYGGYFRVWGWSAGFAQCKCLVSGVGVFTWPCSNQLMAPIRGKQQQLKLLVAEQIGCVFIVVLNRKGALRWFGCFFPSSRKLSGHFIAILVEKSVTEGVWSAVLILGQDLHLGLFH